MKLKFLFASIGMLCGHAHAITTYHFSQYKGRQNSPFPSVNGVVSYFVEDFETQNGSNRPNSLLTTPNATGWNGGSVGSLLWGVQEDYLSGQKDGELGYVWTSSFSTPGGNKAPMGIHFDFTPDEQGRLPEYVGAALRGFGLLGNGSFSNLILVYDQNGVEVTNGEWQIPKLTPNPNQPIEELFLNFEGIYVPGGISRIHFRDFTEVDHLTYGYSIPEISTIWLTAGVGILLLRRKR